MKLFYKHTIIILFALMAFLPKWAVGVEWIGSSNLVGSGTFYFNDAPAGYSGHQFTSNYPGDGTVYTSIGNIQKIGPNTATLYIRTSHTIDLTGTITVTEGTLEIQLNGQILAKTGAGRVVTINGGTLIIKDANPSVSHKGKLVSVTIGEGSNTYTHTNIWQENASGTVEIKGGIITGGRSALRENGGCILVNAGGTLSIEGGTLAGNVSGFNGGAVYLGGASGNKATFTMSGGTICYNAGVSGGGVLALSHTSFTMTGGSINNNVARDWGPANGGNGGAVYCGTADVSMAIKKGEFIGNKALCRGTAGGSGGAFSINAPGLIMEFGASGTVLIQDNEAGSTGGGISAESTTSLTFLNGNVTIDNNTAGGDGGGVCCGDNAGTSPNYTRLRIYGATITNNKVGSGKRGGGIYDRNSYINFGGTANINVYGNTAGGSPNDIYLNLGTITVESSGIKPVNVGIYKPGTATDLAFFYSSSGSNVLQTVYNNINSGTYKVFSNRTQYKIKPYPGGDNNNIYFTLLPYAWSTTQKGITASDLRLVSGVYEIANVKELTAFLCHVNGFSTNDVHFGTGDLSAKGKLTADINMSGHYWVPIANGYKGIFDGNGYSISGLTLAADHPSSERGMFGQLAAGCEVKNLQLHSCNYSTSIATWMGGIASRVLGGTIHDCLFDGTLAGNNTATYIGGLVGSAGNVDIHSCCAMATLSGGTRMGGLVGSLSGGRVKNCFANPTLTTGAYAGGLVGYSTGTLDNCYLRGSASFAGTSTPGTITHCYCPQGSSPAGTNGWYSATVTPYKYRHADNQVTVNGTTKSLLQWLNDGRASGHTAWMRTCGSPINGDYPILMFPNSVCVGSTSSDGKILEYSNNFNTKFGNYIASNTGTIYLFKTPSETVTNSNSGKNTKLYIQEDVALIHTSVITNAYVGVTLKNAAWHMFSPALSDAPLGINYNNDNTVYPYLTPPTEYAFYPESTYDGYFPSTDFGNGSYYADYDYYCYYEPEYHWINFKRNTPSHWHEDLAPGHPNIEYHWDNNPGNASSLGNETSLKPGKGYLLGINKTNTYLQSHGTLNPSNGTGNVTFPVSRKSGWRIGYNLIGNPYQAYLDFKLFADANSGSGKIWNNASSAFYLMIYDGAYHQHVYNASTNQLQAPRCLHPHQGFMVITANDNINATFTNAMRVKSNATNAPFRDEPQIDYPLVNLIATDDEGKSDIMTVELGRPEVGGAPKIYDLHLGKGSLYVNYEDQDYAIAFTQPGVSEVGVRFAADEEATFTMTWDMENGDFSFLHLIDNMTGSDIDCLRDSTYCFTARPSDYKSRFRLVFDYTGIEEPETPEPGEEPAIFAFQMGNELVVNGEGQLQMFDLAGRQVLTTTTYGTQSRVALPEIAAGIYVLRMNGKNGMKTQKIVIE